MCAALTVHHSVHVQRTRSYLPKPSLRFSYTLSLSPRLWVTVVLYAWSTMIGIPLTVCTDSIYTRWRMTADIVTCTRYLLSCGRRGERGSGGEGGEGCVIGGGVSRFARGHVSRSQLLAWAQSRTWSCPRTSSRWTHATRTESRTLVRER